MGYIESQHRDKKVVRWVRDGVDPSRRVVALGKLPKF